MSRPRKAGLWLVLLLIATSLVSVVAWGEVSFHTGEAGEATWWYCRDYLDGLGNTELCAACPTDDFCTVADHYNVELATYNNTDDWAYAALAVAERFPLGDLTGIGFQYKMRNAVQTDSGPSAALHLVAPNGDHMVAISVGAVPQTAACTAFDATAVNWWWGDFEKNNETPQEWDPSTISNIQTGTFVALLAALPNHAVHSAWALMGVTGSTVGSAGGNPIESGMTLIDEFVLTWTSNAVNYGGIYQLEKPWPTTVTFDDWTQAPLPTDEEPREGDRWCRCDHCLIVDDSNLWSIVHETDLAGAPAGALPFHGSSPYALYFGDPATRNYDTGDAAVGMICSTFNELNPGDEYVSISFDYFREVEQYDGQFDWTYVQIQFLDDQGNVVWASLPVTWYDPFDYVTNHKNPGDIHPQGNAVDPEVDPACAELGWKTVWYKDSSHANEGAWQNAVITHYLDETEEPYSDDAYRLRIPPAATRMKVRFGFNSVDGSKNGYLGWIVDNVKKEHSAEPPGCTIVTETLPQGEIGVKYDFWLNPNCQSHSSVRSYTLVDVKKNGVSQGANLPERLALDSCGRLYGEPDPGTSGTYEITLRLVCTDGGSQTKTLFLNIRAPATNTSSMIGQAGELPENFGGATSGLWRVDGQPFGLQQGCPNLWHEAHHVKYALDTAALKADYGEVAFFGQDDDGIPHTLSGWDPNYQCSRAKGCLTSKLYQVVDPSHDGQELVVGFKSWRNVEFFEGGEYDITSVEVRREGESSWTEIWRRTSQDVSLATWTWQEVHTGILLEYGQKVQIRFCFDSVDAYSNRKDGECYGWLIDEVSLYAGSAELNIVNCPRETTSVGDFYKEKITASGGTAGLALIWEIAIGELPPGLGLTVDPIDRRTAWIEGIPREENGGRGGEYSKTFTIRVRDANWNEVATRQCTITVGSNVTLLIEDFENDPAWSQGGLWHFTVDAGVAGVPDLGAANHAAYYGRDDQGAGTGPNYDVQAVTSGMLTLVDTDVSQPGDTLIDTTGVSAFKVQFDYFRQVESFGGQYDRTLVQVKFGSAGEWKTIFVLDSSTVSDAEWKTVQVGPYNTEGDTMSIRFLFDSVDKWYNDYIGWLVDNLKIESATTGSPIPPMSLRSDPRDPSESLDLRNVPNPITDVHTTTFMVRSEGVEAMRIEIYDLSGKLVFSKEVPSNELVWHTDNDFGEYLSNGIYIYRAYVLMNGDWVETDFRKLVILR